MLLKTNKTNYKIILFASKFYILSFSLARVCGLSNIGAFVCVACVCCECVWWQWITPAVVCARSIRGSTWWTASIPCSWASGTACAAAPAAWCACVGCIPVGRFFFVILWNSSTSCRAYLCGFVRQLDLDLAATRSQPQEHLLAVVQNHDVVIGKVVLAKIGALFRHREVALLVRAAEQPGVVHVLGVGVVRFATAQRHPEEVLRLFALVQDLPGRFLFEVLFKVRIDENLSPAS